MSSKLLDARGDGRVTNPAELLNKVYDLHRRSHHYSLKVTQEKIYIMNLAEVQKYDILVVQEAFELYEEQGKPRPHPNYFMAICRRLAKEEQKKIDSEPKHILGKTI